MVLTWTTTSRQPLHLLAADPDQEPVFQNPLLEDLGSLQGLLATPRLTIPAKGRRVRGATFALLHALNGNVLAFVKDRLTPTKRIRLRSTTSSWTGGFRNFEIFPPRFPRMNRPFLLVGSMIPWVILQPRDPGNRASLKKGHEILVFSLRRRPEHFQEATDVQTSITRPPSRRCFGVISRIFRSKANRSSVIEFLRYELSGGHV